MDSNAWRRYAEPLLKKLRDLDLVTTPPLEELFWSVPRHQFIDEFFQHDPDTYSWHKMDAPENRIADPEWLAAVYQDVPLVVGIDESGIPYCSNSAPTLVFRLLGFLNVRPGDRVLEIGTGTGHLTAMLGRLASPGGHVTSLEIEPELARRAAEHVAAAVPEAAVAITVADGRSWRSGAEHRHDAVVSTGSCWPVPDSWLAALAPGGRLCTEMRSALSGALLLARCSPSQDSQGTVTGYFSDQPAGFMPLRAPSSGFHEPIALPFGFGTHETSRAMAEGLGEKQLRGPFAWYCQLELPDAKLLWLDADQSGRSAAYLLADDGLDAVRLPEDGTSALSELVAYGGSSFLIDRLLSAWRDWQENGSPELTQYKFQYSEDGRQRIVLKGHDKCWTF